MTDTAFAAIIGFATLVANQFFTAWRAEQAIKERAIELKEQTQQAAEKLDQSTKEVAKQLAVKQEAIYAKSALERQALHTELRENTELTKVGNNIKADILNSQRDIVDSQKDIRSLKDANEAASSAQLDRIEQHGLDRTTQLNRIEGTEIDTNVKVSDLHEDLKP